MSDQPHSAARRPSPAAMPRRRASVAARRSAPLPPGGRSRSRDERGGALSRRPGPPDPLRDHQAVAPYGLVPLPDHPMPAERLQESVLRNGVTQRHVLAGHDRRIPGTHTGWIDLEIRSLTPLFVGATHKGADPARSLTIDGRPALPGATLRGLTRNVLRVVTGGETGHVNTPQLFFRAPAASSTDKRARHVMRNQNRRYRERHGAPSSPPGAPVKAGFLRYLGAGRGWVIHPLPVERPLQVRLTDVRDDLARYPALPPFPLPAPSGDPAAGGHVPAETHREFQFLRVTALCPDIDGRTIGETRFWAMAVLPAGEPVTPAHRETVRDRLRERWSEKLVRAQQAVDKAGGERARASARGRRNDIDRAMERVDSIGIRSHDCVLVLTGAAGERKNAYLFPTGIDPELRLPVPDHLVRMVESADQITRFQERNFPVDLTTGLTLGEAAPQTPAAPGRERPGGLDRGACEPVWYQDSGGHVISFGRSGGYRVAVGEYDPIRRALPNGVLSPDPADPGAAGRTPDIPRALFGDIDLLPQREGAGPAVRGRVSVGSAVCTDPDPWFPHALRVELLSPQRSCFANYLLQPMTDRTWGSAPDLVTWSHEGDVRLGGYKVYLHRHDPLPDEGRRYAGLRADRVPDGDTKRDVVPLRAGLTFHGRITFTNLTDAEIGALLRALLLGNPADGGDTADPVYAHKLGLGKALGFGSVHITPVLHLIDHAERAASLDPGAGVQRVGAEGVQKLLDAFDDALLTWEREESVRAGRSLPDDWTDVARVQALLLAAQWRDRLPESWTRVMELEEFSVYPVLPALRDRFAAHTRISQTAPG
ncbi:TIGR03986 family CRISPR-associated RAMP protein [Nocardiopsis sediminis]|uniref:TIGR03986 family CRISPR-associated RAMP protein n=1 Tax=Nocardiopsis sediminis TaxID=1778267 RepID=A0ABV8FI41_9ACTN